MPGASFYEDENFKNSVIDSFKKIKTVSQLASLLSLIERKIDPNVSHKKITARTLHYLSISKDTRYREFNIPKKNGTQRTINAPDYPLRRIQQLLNALLQIVFEKSVHYNTNGFLINRDIVRNATPHVNKKYLLNIDIENYFPTIEFRRVKTVLGLSPFNLREDREGVAFVIANICTQNGVLPQGAPTSPILSNIVTQKLDRRITKFCLSHKVRYSRYADDLSFSCNQSVMDESFVEEIAAIVTSERFVINVSKTRLQTTNERQEVTGIIVNQKLNVNREYIQKIRAILHNWETNGLDYTQDKFNSFYSHKRKGFPDFRLVLRGYINYVGLVRGKEDLLYGGLVQKFNRLYHYIDYDFVENADVKAKLIKDNVRMEMILLDKVHPEDDKFISFCTAAFHQIENLLNYFYSRRFPIFDDLKMFLFTKLDYLTSKPNKESISKLDISLLVNIFEKELYFDKGIYTDKELTTLRLARNDDSHRCQVDMCDVLKIKNDYLHLEHQLNEYYHINNKSLEFNKEQKKKNNDLKGKYNLIMLLENKDYNKVRGILRTFVEQVKNWNYN